MLGNPPANLGMGAMWGCPPCPGFALLQVADERFCPDMMSTAKEMNVANFRRVPKMPVYGTAQPSSKVRDMHSAAGRDTQNRGPNPPHHPPLPSEPGQCPAVPDGCQEEAQTHPLDQPARRSGPGGERADLYAAGARAAGGADPRAHRLASAAGGEPDVGYKAGVLLVLFFSFGNDRQAVVVLGAVLGLHPPCVLQAVDSPADAEPGG